MDAAKTNAPANRHPVAKVGLDELTGVWNRAGFIAAATPMFVVCQRRVAPATLGYFEVRSAHANPSRADEAMLSGVLKAVATQMRRTFRDCDVIGRIDTFRLAVLFADCTDEALGAIEGARAVTDESTPPNSNILAVAMVQSSPGASFADLMHEADLRTNELKLRDAADPAAASASKNAADARRDDHTPRAVPAKVSKRWARSSR